MSNPDPNHDETEPNVLPDTKMPSYEEMEELRLEKIMQNAKEEEERILHNGELFRSLDLTKEI